MSQENKNDLALVDEADLSLVDNNSLNGKQLALILKRTPSQYVHKRPAKGGGQWEYVTGGYVRKCLNLMFGWDWSFEIISREVIYGEAIVEGKLTCNSNGRSIVKMQFGNKDIVYKKQSDEDRDKGLDRIPLSIGNDLKAAATDALKKCAAELGIAADIYNKEDFREIKVVESDDTMSKIIALYDVKREEMSKEDIENADRIINNKEKASYSKLLKNLKSL